MCLKKQMRIPIFLAILAIMQSTSVSAYDQMKRIGQFHPHEDFKDLRPNIWVIAPNTKVKVTVHGRENFVMSSTPELWYLKNSRVFQDWTFKEMHGLKIKFGGHDVQPNDVFIYKEGLYYQVSRLFLRAILTFTDDNRNKLAEIRGKEIWFDGENIGELPENGVPGKWYSDPLDLQIVLSEDFHDDLTLDFYSSEATLSGWDGNKALIRLSGNASFRAGELSLKECWIHSDRSEVVIQSLSCEKLDASAGGKSTVTIKSGHIKKLAAGETLGGKVEVLAEVDKPDGASIGLTNSQKIIEKETAQGSTIKFPDHGNFDF